MGDSGWSDSYSSEDNWSPRRSDSSTSIYDSSTNNDSSQLSTNQMSSFIEQAFEMSVGKIEETPRVPSPAPEQPLLPLQTNEPEVSEPIGNQDLGIFDFIFNQPINDQNPPWEELDIGIDH